MFRLGWERREAKLIDQRFLERGAYNVHSPVRYQVWEYLVEFHDEGGTTVRLPIKEKTFKVDLPQLGGTVPILVNRRRTKAAFDLKDPRIDAVGRLKARERRRKKADRERFEQKLR